jgi:competence protein ComGC
MKKQKIALSLLILTVLTTTLFVVPSALAQSTTATNNKPNFFQGLITYIEQKFGLNKDQVTTAVNDYKNQVNAIKATTTPRPTLTPDQIQAQEKTRLDKLVAAGKITADQESAILTELTTLQAKYNLSGLTGTQRRTQMQLIQTDLKTWATSNNINIAYIQMFGGREGTGDKDGFRGQRGPKLTTTPAQ